MPQIVSKLIPSAPVESSANPGRPNQGRRAQAPPAWVKKQDRDPKDRLTGTIARIHPDGGFGFIHADSGGEYFVHSNTVRNKQAWKVGQRVSFLVGAIKSGTGKKPPAYGVYGASEQKPNEVDQ